MGEMPALVETHPEHPVSRLEKGEVDAHVGLGAGMRLDIGVLSSEQLLCPIDGQLLHFVHHLTAFVVTASRVTLGIFVGQHRARSCHHGR
jgi:hypothetical protein